MEAVITVVGIGPGSRDYIIPAAEKAIEAATILIGSKRALTEFASERQCQRVVDKDIEGVLDFIAAADEQEKVVVMVSGDPGFYSLLAAIKERFDSEAIKVIPGISSVQAAFARIGEIWQNAEFISLHGRTADERRLRYEPGRVLGILTDGKYCPQAIAECLLKYSWPQDAVVHLCENISYDTERVLEMSLQAASRQEGFAHCVMVVKG